MLSKCMNPACDARFLYLRQGRLFKLEIRGITLAAAVHPEHFWLCDDCARTMTVVFDRGVVSAQPLHLEPPKSAPKVEGKTVRRVLAWKAHPGWKG